MSTTKITADSTMQQVLEAYPGARRALFRRHHIGGCSSCGFSPEDRLGDVLARHNVFGVHEVIDQIQRSHDEERKLQIDAKELAAQLAGDTPPRLVDVRGPDEQAVVQLNGAFAATPELVQEIMTRWPKDTPIVTICHHGSRSLDAAAYLMGHGFTNVRSLAGGIDAWATEVDASVGRY